MSFDIIRCMPTTERKSFAVRMDVVDLARLDRARGLVPRERFVRDAVMAAVAAVEAREGKR